MRRSFFLFVVALSVIVGLALKSSRPRDFIQQTARLDFLPISGDGGVGALWVVVPGARENDSVLVNAPTIADGMVYQAYVLQPDVVAVTATNTTIGGSFDPAEGIFTLLVARRR